MFDDISDLDSRYVLLGNRQDNYVSDKTSNSTEKFIFSVGLRDWGIRLFELKEP